MLVRVVRSARRNESSILIVDPIKRFSVRHEDVKKLSDLEWVVAPIDPWWPYSQQIMPGIQL